MSQFTLLRHRRFGPFFWTQFLVGALNDNLLKSSLVILVAFGAASASLDGDTLVNLAGGITARTSIERMITCSPIPVVPLAARRPALSGGAALSARGDRPAGSRRRARGRRDPA